LGMVAVGRWPLAVGRWPLAVGEQPSPEPLRQSVVEQAGLVADQRR
jgi:hypothetical protein